MPLLRDGNVVEDRWTRVDDAAEIPADAPAIVGFARLAREGDALTGRNGPLGVALRNTDAVEDLAPYLPRLALVALEFPKFSDGRAFSQARLLRERHGFKGELRATGNVLPDQLLHMRRCGFDAFELAKGDPAKSWARAVRGFSAHYQPAGDAAAPVSALRRRVAAAAD
ncbi:MAG: DUF934 domain-containing protein [Rhodospirillales bacterium]|nr:MAG: DUF934 domain-containing protein [Rhodospirillales bacterium]